MARYFRAEGLHLTEKIETKVDRTEKSEIKEIKNALWRNNSRPSLDTRKRLHELRALSIAEIAKIDNDLLGFQIEMNNLLGKIRSSTSTRSQHESLVYSYTAQLSPVRLLPPEILVEIFKYALPDRLNSNSKLFPLALCSVCSAWREAALAYPTLWNGLLPRDPDASYVDDTYIDYGFSHSPTGTLSFSIYSPSQMHRINYDDYVRTTIVFRSISPFYRLLSDLDIHIHFLDSVFPFLTLPSGSIPLLEEISLTVDHVRENIAIPPITVFQNATRLSRIALIVPLDFLEGFLVELLPWSQLTHLELMNPIELLLFVKVISQGKQLVDATFSLDIYADDSEFGLITQLCKSSVQLAHLSAIRLHAFSQDMTDIHENLLQRIMSSLRLPALETLEFAGKDHAMPVKLNTIIPTISQHPLPSLRALVLSYLHANISELTEVLSACPDLEELSLYLDTTTPVPVDPARILQSLRQHPEVEDNAITKSQRTPHVSHNFPHLTSFTFSFLCHRIQESEVVAAEFGTLISTWAQDESRASALRIITMYICDERAANWTGHAAVFAKLAERLSPWSKDNNVAEAGEGRFLLTTYLVRESQPVGQI
ncbi:hypothetical protein H0H81_006000 [Sphagnurus paluster]|uniref:F-box domain-containing protein n=1 Tax=Sphagnurus paluster TaxID=117069 RepID=A0A9P7K5E2_9AGAR|nr:hypothetical protein H0H81_006000 [Sphagnurus paluster]